MKKVLLLFLLFAGLSTVSYAQSGKEKSGGFFSRFGARKSRKQMTHFEQPKKDPNIQNNGTSYRMNRKREYVVDGNGFSTPKQGKRRKRK
jgi:hypothetical protein